MNSPNTVLPFNQPGTFADPLTEVLRSGARQLLMQAIEMEAADFLEVMKERKLADGRDRFVRHGHGPQRSIQTGIGPVEVSRVKIRDRGADEGDPTRFHSSLLPLWARRSRSMDALLPALYLRGISSGDFSTVLSALLGADAPNLSPQVLSRLKSEWAEEFARWQKRNLTARRYVYFWADGIYLQARAEDHKECILVIIGATPEGRKELVGFQAGVRESTQSWRELLIDIKARGLTISPQLAVGDGALGFWKALEEIHPETGHQRCWVHKTCNVLDKIAKSLHPAVKRDLKEIWLSPDRASARAAIAVFSEKYRTKYPKAVQCLVNDEEALLAFYDFPAEHWGHLRTTNPIESVFATVRHRTVRTKGSLSPETARIMVFKLIMAAAKTWQKLHGKNQLPKVVQGAIFRDGVEAVDTINTVAA